MPNHTAENDPGKDGGPHSSFGPSHKRIYVWFVMFAQYFALGLLRPEMPGILLELLNNSMTQVAIYQGITDAVGAIVAFALVPMLGEYSDRHGRKSSLILSALCAAAPVYVLALYPVLFSILTTLILYAVVAMVSKMNSYSVALSYVADCSTIKDRSSAFAEVSGMMFAGLTVGPLVSGFLPRDIAIWSAAIISIVAVVYIVIVVPETVADAHKKHDCDDDASLSSSSSSAGDERSQLLNKGKSSSYGSTASSSKSDANSAGESVDIDSGKSQSKFAALLFLGPTFFAGSALYTLIGVITLLSQLAIFGVGQIYYLYLKEELGFQRDDLIHAAFIGGAITSVIMLLAMPRLSHKFHESTMMVWSLAAYAIYALGLAIAVSSRSQAFALIPFWSISSMLFPSTCSLLSNHTAQKSTGLAQGALSAVKCCASGFGPAAFALLFSYMITLKHRELGTSSQVNYAEDTAQLGVGHFSVHYTGIPFVLATILILVSLVLTLYLPQVRVHPSTISKQQGQNDDGTSSKTGSDTSIEHKSASSSTRGGFVRRRAGGHIIPGVFGHHTYHDEWHYQKAHMRRHDLLRAPSTAQPSDVSDSDMDVNDLTGGVGEEDLKHAPARAPSSRWTLLAVIVTVIILCLVAFSIIGHLPQDSNATPHTSTSSSAYLSELLPWSADAAEMTSDGDTSAGNTNSSNSNNDNNPTDSSTGIKPETQGMTVLALMGPQGVGKTALGHHLTNTFGLYPLSSGELIRKEIAAGSPIGVRVKAAVESGALVDDITVLAILRNAIDELALNKSISGVILDGFPRRISQCELLDSPNTGIPPVAVMIYVHMREDILAERRRGRRVCPVCDRGYNLNAIDRDGYDLPARVPQKNPTQCDFDGATLVEREDDSDQVAEHRMIVFHNESQPMAAYYENQHKLIEIEKRINAGEMLLLIRDRIAAYIEREKSIVLQAHKYNRSIAEQEEMTPVIRTTTKDMKLAKPVVAPPNNDTTPVTASSTVAIVDHAEEDDYE